MPIDIEFFYHTESISCCFQILNLNRIELAPNNTSMLNFSVQRKRQLIENFFPLRANVVNKLS